MKNLKKILICSVSIFVLGLFAYLSPILAKEIDFGTASDTTFFLGNVGIGATSPDTTLNVEGDFRTSGRHIIFSELAGGGDRCLQIDNNGYMSAAASACGTSSGGDNLGNGVATTNIQLGTYWLSGDGNNEGVYVDGSGRVGVGTSSPGAFLHLKAGTTVAGSAPLKFTTGTNMSVAEAGAMEWDGSRLYITTSVPTRQTLAFLTDTHNAVTLGAIGSSPNANGMTLSTQALNLQPASASYGGVVTTGTQTLAGAKTFSSTATFSSASTYSALFTGGNVGMGTTTPGAKLHALATTEQLRLGYDNAKYNSFTVGSTGSLTIAAVGTNPNITLTPGGTGYTLLNGSVGIGTATPTTAKLVLATSGTYSLDAGAKPMTGLGAPILNTDAATKNYVDTAVGAVGGVSYWLSDGGSGLYATTSVTSVGIGTEAPSGAALEVHGNFYLAGGAGDVNGDAAVNAQDALLAAQWLDGQVSLNPYQLAEADVDGNGIVSNFDVRSIQLRFVNMAGFTSTDQMHATTKRILGKAIDYDVSGNVSIGGFSTSSSAVLNDKLTVFGSLLMSGGNLKTNGAYINYNSTSSTGLYVDSSNNVQLTGVNLGTNGGYISYGGTNAGIYVNSSNNVGVGTTNATQKLTVSGNVQVNTGSVTADAFYYNSDRNLKKDILDISNPLAKVLNLKGVTFKWRSNGETNYGFIAQDVEKVVPELVATGADGQKSVAYGNVSALLVEAFKAQQTEINNLELRIKQLEKNTK